MSEKEIRKKKNLIQERNAGGGRKRERKKTKIMVEEKQFNRNRQSNKYERYEKER